MRLMSTIIYIHGSVGLASDGVRKDGQKIRRHENCMVISHTGLGRSSIAVAGYVV